MVFVLYLDSSASSPEVLYHMENDAITIIESTTSQDISDTDIIDASTVQLQLYNCTSQDVLNIHSIDSSVVTPE